MNLKQTEKIINIKSSLFKEVQDACRDILKNHSIAQEARIYLNSRMTDDNQEKFNLGYFPDDENLEILFEKVSEKKLKFLNIIYPYHVQNGEYRVYINKSLLSNHNIVMPYVDIYGNIKALVGRSFLCEEDRKEKKIQKYKYTKFNKSLHLFGFYQAKSSILKKNSVIIVEGQIDCITCHEYGINNVVALGGSSLTKRQFQLLNRYTENIYLLLDNDIEGKKSQNKIIKKYSNLANFKSLELPNNYKDIDKYLRTEQKSSYIFNTI
jgi:DNA primase